MRIAIEATLAQGGGTGFGKYLDRLLENLAAIGGDDTHILMHATKEWRGKDYGKNFVTASYHMTGFQSIDILLNLNRTLRRHGADLFHATCTTGAPPKSDIPVVSTIHDLYPLNHPEGCARRQAIMFKTLFKWTLKSSSLFITNSQCTSEELAGRSPPGSADRTRLIYLGPSFAESEYVGPAEKKKSHILCVGGVEKRKGQLMLLEAYAAAVRKTPDIPPLVLIGPDRGEGSKLDALTSRLALGEKTRWLRYVDEAELVKYYRSAAAFVFPSTHEGFGIPLVDAMKFGLPVFCGDIPICREVAADYPVFLPHDSGAWADAMSAFFSGNSAHEFGREKAAPVLKKYSWSRCAAETLECYRSVLANARKTKS